MNLFEWFEQCKKRAREQGLVLEPITLREAEAFGNCAVQALLEKVGKNLWP